MALTLKKIKNLEFMVIILLMKITECSLRARLFLSYWLIQGQHVLTCTEHDVFGQVLEVGRGPLPGRSSLQLVAAHLEQCSLLLLSYTATRNVNTVCSYSALKSFSWFCLAYNGLLCFWNRIRILLLYKADGSFALVITHRYINISMLLP
mgnify:FL=1